MVLLTRCLLDISARALCALLHHPLTPARQRPKLDEVARRAGVYKSQISEWANGRRPIPRGQIADLARAFLALGCPAGLVRGLVSAWLRETGFADGWITVRLLSNVRSASRSASL